MSSFRVNPFATSLAFYLSILPFDSLLVLSIYTLRALGLAHFLSLGFRVSGLRSLFPPFVFPVKQWFPSHESTRPFRNEWAFVSVLKNPVIDSAAIESKPIESATAGTVSGVQIAVVGIFSAATAIDSEVAALLSAYWAWLLWLFLTKLLVSGADERKKNPVAIERDSVGCQPFSVKNMYLWYRVR